MAGVETRNDTKHMWNTTPEIVKLAADVHEPVLLQLHKDLGNTIDKSHIYKRCKARLVGRLEAPEKTYIFKLYSERSIRHAAKQRIQRSRAQRYSKRMEQLIASGIATPKPVAYLEERWGPFRGRSCLLLEYISGPLLNQSVQLLQLVNATHPGVDPVTFITHQLIEARDKLLALRLQHHDVHGGNFIFDGNCQMHLLDSEAIRPSMARKRSAVLVRERFARLIRVVRTELANPRPAADDSRHATPLANGLTGSGNQSLQDAA